MNYPKQYLLADRPLTTLAGWRQIIFMGWWLSLAPDVPLILVVDKAGEPIGVIIGWVILHGRLLKNGDELVGSWRDSGIIAEYDELCGRFVYFFFREGEVGVVTDAGGMMSVVFNAKQKLVASTPAIMQLLAEQQWDENIRRRFSGGKPESWYAFGVTPYVDVQRLLANHALSLADWRPQRIFPLASDQLLPGNMAKNPDDSVKEIAEIIKSNVLALVNAGHNIAHLTGGWDSRMVLAACRGNLSGVQFQTVRNNSPGTKLDCHIAEVIAERFGINYRQIPFVEPTKEEVVEWLERSGYCVEDTVATFCATAKANNTNSHEIMGTGGEATRAVYWYSGDDTKETLSAPELLLRFEIVENDYTVRLAEQWLASLPTGVSVGNILDLGYVELRISCWGGPSLFGHDLLYPTISPFNSGAYYKALLSLPETYRLEGHVTPGIIDYLWPELLTIPINRAVGLAKLRFLRQEIRLRTPIEIRDKIKWLIQLLRGERHMLDKYMKPTSESDQAN